MVVPRTLAFRGRSRERLVLDRLLSQARGGEGTVLVIRGEAGIGKTALMQYLARQASGCQVRQVAGVKSEMDLPFAVLHQLCAPMLDRITALPSDKASNVTGIALPVDGGYSVP